MKCLLCGSTDVKVAFHLPGASRLSQKLLTADELKHGGDDRIAVDLYSCNACDMVQVDPSTLRQPSDYWVNYLNSRAATELYVEYDRHLADTLVNRYKLKGKTCIEVGCGDGYFSNELMKRGVSVTAIEPSSRACKVAAAKYGVKTINAYLDDQITTRVSEKFDSFVCKQVMDLLEGANDLLRNLGSILKPGAIGLIDVPSLTKTLLDKRYYSVIPDRVGYYSASTLTKILERNHFHVFEVFHGAEDEYVGAYAIYEGEKNGLLNSFGDDFEQFNEAFQGLLRKYRSQGKTVAGWGAGAKGVTVFAFTGVGPEDIQFVVDRDANRWGMYLPGSALPVVSPDEIKSRKPDAVIITAAMFYKEIVRDLVGNFHYKGDIIVLAPLPHVISQQEIAEIVGG